VRVVRRAQERERPVVPEDVAVEPLPVAVRVVRERVLRADGGEHAVLGEQLPRVGGDAEARHRGQLQESTSLHLRSPWGAVSRRADGRRGRPPTVMTVITTRAPAYHGPAHPAACGARSPWRQAGRETACALATAVPRAERRSDAYLRARRRADVGTARPVARADGTAASRAGAGTSIPRPMIPRASGADPSGTGVAGCALIGPTRRRR
jgi:hypothetical protein